MRHHTEESPSTAGLLLSLASALPPGLPLARRARALAGRLAHGAADRTAQRRAADLLCDLLDATDAGASTETDGLLDEDFDA